MEKFTIENEMRNAILNALGDYERANYKLCIKEYGIASYLHDLYEDEYSEIPESLNEAFNELSDLVDGIICVA